MFRERRNTPYFLKLYVKYIEPVAETYAYCLLKNHFHLLVRIKDQEEWHSLHECHSFNPSRAFANMFGTYTKPFNRAYQRTRLAAPIKLSHHFAHLHIFPFVYLPIGTGSTAGPVLNNCTVKNPTRPSSRH